MTLAKFEIIPNQEFKNIAIEVAKEEVKNSLVNTLWYVDVNKLAELTSLSRRTLEEYVLCDVRVRAIEIRRGTKRLYKVEEIRKVLDEVFSEW